ncbi:heterokaryon incompatibility protein-domain-containing protein [Annulohypoxylon maeteangense]|uniref:heterokaryon incompatibility protein-domain-containing protein n=1 Tax=Annulohypoxylon maeteangense TaxID=1927788 RepID=UPI0020081AE8|nr:heterokaryon incompatibility protein-domain-containing protein [Annulohypoxylon maeteangense]KAI0886003.1 heterokaryon incompatibility protein-domain-containing protein [Annulohypoxylon maeteangense]
MAITRPEHWAMEYLDYKIGHGLFEIRPGHSQHRTESDEDRLQEEECGVCHRPRDGCFEGVVGDLKDGMARGCRLCDALHQIIVATTQEPHQLSHPFRLEIRKGMPATLDICVATVTTGEVYQPIFAKYQIFFQANATRRPPSLSAFNNIGFGSPVASTSRSTQCLSFAKAALNQCLSKHNCGQSTTDPILPTRVLDLGPPSSTTISLKLLEPTPGTRARYAALSHCWGPHAKRLETKLATLSSLKSNIPWTDLPPTFQDAVTTTRFLGLRYVWIDSLCIIQDSPADWDIESSRMASVYRDASVTIAAVSSSSSDESFLKPRNAIFQARLLPLMLSRADRALPAEELGLVVPGTSPFYALGVRPLAVHNMDGPLSERAWTFQEEKLSSRILRFGDAELSFECRRGVACECDMYGAEYDNSTEAPSGPPLHGLAALNLASETAGSGEEGAEGEGQERRVGRLPPQLDPFLAWQDRVTEYSKRKLTFASDKLPALAGLATICHAITQSEYVAGLWRDHFVLDLLWHPAGPRNLAPEPENPFRNPATASWKPGLSIPSDKLPSSENLSSCYLKRQRTAAAHASLLAMDIPSDFGTPSPSKPSAESPTTGFVEAYRAPTFSWASISSSIAFYPVSNPQTIEIETTLQEAHTTLTGINPFGRISDSHVVLRGPLLQARISTRPLRRNYGSYILKHNNSIVGFKADLPLTLSPPPSPSPSPSSETEPIVTRATATSPPHTRFKDMCVWCMSLFHAKDGSVREVLVLGRSARVEGAYERLGLVDASAPGTVRCLNRWFEDEGDGTAAVVSEVRCV